MYFGISVMQHVRTSVINFWLSTFVTIVWVGLVFFFIIFFSFMTRHW